MSNTTFAIILYIIGGLLSFFHEMSDNIEYAVKRHEKDPVLKKIPVKAYLTAMMITVFVLDALWPIFTVINLLVALQPDKAQDDVKQ